MNILVTGGAGFVGSHLCERLLNEGHHVICVDSFFSGKIENIKHNLKNPNFRLIKHDVRKPLLKELGSEKIDRIYNLACPASPDQYQFDPILTLETSVIGAQNMLKLARRTGARFLQTSTSEIYGDPLEHPQKETYWGNVDTLGKRACYDEGKRAAETLCKDYRLQYGVDARLVRIFNTYGPRMMFSDGRGLSNFILQAFLNEEITIHGDGLQTRSFCYVDDLVEGLIKRMEIESDDWLPVNLGNPDERSILEVARIVKQKINSKSEIKHLSEKEAPNRMGDPRQRCPNISRAKDFLGWEPKIGFDEGLDKTIADFKKRLENKPHVAVFTPSFLPMKGPAEEKASEVMEQLAGWEFDIFTARLDKKLEKETHDGRMHIYRLGSGSILDKYLLPVRAALRAKKMDKKYDYRISWAVMASYGALAATLFSWIAKGSKPMLLSVYEGDITEKMLKKGKMLAPIYKFIFRQAHRWQVIGQMNEQQRAWLEDERKVQAIRIDDDKKLLAKRTKEMFQELEILSTRL